MKVIYCALLLGWAQCSSAEQVPGSSITDSIPDRAREQCAVEPAGYPKSDIIGDLCDKQSAWDEKARQVVAGASSDCHIDPITKAMICKRAASCKGGEVDHFRQVMTSTKVEYDCMSSCGHQGSLLISCCNACALLVPTDLGKINGQSVGQVVCTGCSKKEQATAVANHVDCSLDLATGKYKCAETAKCSTNSPVVQSTDTDAYACKVNDCHLCSDGQLKAKCCATCLNNMCSGTPKDRMACLGCGGDSAPSAPAPASSEASASVSTGSFDDSGTLKWVAAICVLGAVVYYVHVHLKVVWAREQAVDVAEEYNRL